jgi:hypothetical protein
VIVSIKVNNKFYLGFMVKSIKNEISHFLPSLSINGKETIFWMGRLICLVGNTVNALYTSIFKWGEHCFLKEKKKEQHYTYQVNAEEFSKVRELFQKGQAAQTEIADQIQKAQDTYQKELAALDYIRRVRALQTIEIIQGKVRAMAIVLGQIDDQNHFPDHLTAVLSAGRELQGFLDQERGILKQPLPNQEVLQHLHQIFQQVKIYYSHVQIMGQALPKKTPQRKEFIQRCQLFLNGIHKQQSIYKVPSSDPYLHALQVNEDKAWRALESLKQQQVVLQGLQKK